jgi:feruloyl esterase
MEAQRYPADFQGIAAGAPAMNFTTQNTFYHGWNARVNTGADGQPILTADKLPILHQAAIAACDALDGLKDGLISDPTRCNFDPLVTQCKPGDDPTRCLTPAQVNAARELYRGAHDEAGNRFVLSGPMPGSELSWVGVFIPPPGQTRAMSQMISTGTLKYLAYETNPAASFTLADFHFDRATFEATTRLHSLYDATDPDLAPFSKAGGKLLLWHGWADPHISPMNSIAYFTAMQRVMGAANVERFARFYLFPGGYHCGGGEGPFDFDLLTPLMSWAERGVAPNELVARHVAGGFGPGGPRGPNAPMGPGGPNGSMGPGGPNAPMGPPPGAMNPAARPDRTRPVYPYPFTAKYRGSGNINDASSFEQGPAQPVDAKLFDWLGSGFYITGFQRACTAAGTQMKCVPAR